MESSTIIQPSRALPPVILANATGIIDLTLDVVLLFVAG
jgi:hypothetical protein